jgi:phage protein D
VPHGEAVSSTLLISVKGAPLADDVAALLAGAYVDDSLHVPDLFVLRFRDEATSVLDKGGFAIGAVVALAVQSSGPGGPIPLIKGEVTALETEVGADGVHTVVRGLDRSHRLFRGRRVEAYLQVTAADVARKVAQRAGLAVGRVDHRGPVLKHVAQDGVSDWEFLRRLAVETGAVLTVRDGELDFRAPQQAGAAPSGAAGARSDPLVLERGVNLISLRATVTSAGQVPDVEVRGWDPENKRALVAVVPARTRSAELNGTTPAGLAGVFSSPRWVEPVSAYRTQQQCDTAARAVSERLAGGFAELDGVVRGNPRLRAGVAVALAGVGRPFEGRYALTSSRHEFSPETGYLTSFTVSNTSERSLYGAANGVTPGSSAGGVMTATVSDVKDPDKRGRVRVTFPVMSDTYVSWWARVVQQGAGNGRGAVVLPEVGDEVLVAFGMGSFEEPYVLGGLFNGKDLPQPGWAEHVGATDGAVQRRALTSRKGMVVEMVETPKEERLTVSTNGGAQHVTLVQKADKGISIVSEGPVEITAKKDVVVKTATGSITLEGQKISVKAKTELELSGAKVKVTGTASADVEAPTVKVAGSATAELSASGATTVRGGIVRIN